MNPRTCAKNATPPPLAWALNRPKLASMSWYRNHSPRKIQAGITLLTAAQRVPTNVYAFTQAMGLVNDHLSGCFARGEVEQARRAFRRPG